MSYVGVLAYLLCSPGTWLGMGQQHSRHLAYYVTQHGPGTPGRVCCVGGPALGCAGQAGPCSAHAAACSMLVGLLMRELLHRNIADREAAFVAPWRYHLQEIISRLLRVDVECANLVHSIWDESGVTLHSA